LSAFSCGPNLDTFVSMCRWFVRVSLSTLSIAALLDTSHSLRLRPPMKAHIKLSTNLNSKFDVDMGFGEELTAGEFAAMRRNYKPKKKKKQKDETEKTGIVCARSQEFGHMGMLGCS